MPRNWETIVIVPMLQISGVVQKVGYQSQRNIKVV